MSDRVFDHSYNVLVCTGHHLDHYTASRGYKRLGLLQQHTEQDSCRYLFRFCKIICKVLSDLARHYRHRADIRFRSETDLEACFANNVKRSLADDAAHIELAI